MCACKTFLWCSAWTGPDWWARTVLLTMAALTAYGQAFQRWAGHRRELAEKENAARDYAQRIDMLRWQDKEISEARLQDHGDEGVGHAEKAKADAAPVIDAMAVGIQRLGLIAVVQHLVQGSYRGMDGLGEGGSIQLGVIAKLIGDEIVQVDAHGDRPYPHRRAGYGACPAGRDCQKLSPFYGYAGRAFGAGTGAGQKAGGFRYNPRTLFPWGSVMIY